MPNGVIVLVTRTTVHTILDVDGRYGRIGASHTLTEITPFRDQWVRVAGEWKLKSRVQIDRATVAVDEHAWGM